MECACEIDHFDLLKDESAEKESSAGSPLETGSVLMGTRKVE